MPYIDIGSKNATIDGGAKIIRLKNEISEIHFRIAGNPYFLGKHFVKVDGKWVVSDCSRINQDNTCLVCDDYFELMTQVKKAKAESEDSAIIEELENKAKGKRPSTLFYYPILDRKDKLAKVFEASISIRHKIDEEAKIRDVRNFDFIVRITGKTGSDYYSLTRLDSAETAPMTEDELSEYEKAKNLDVASIVERPVRKSSHEIVSEDNDLLETEIKVDEKEEISPEEVPF